VGFASFVTAKAVFTTARVTEGFGTAFEPLSGAANFNGNSGERFLVTFSNFQPGAQIYVPNVVAGSDATKPTAGGDLGVPASGGQYTPGGGGSLLLALVPNADANGAGGKPIYTPGPPGTATVTFDALSPLTFTNGSATATYEVVDANPSTRENAQIPAFFGLLPFGGGQPFQTNETVSFAPVSNVMAADPTAPIPRFVAVPPPPDCSIVGDCNSQYFPHLSVNQTSLAFTATQGSSPGDQFINVKNTGGGLLSFAVTVTYTSGSGWINFGPTVGFNNTAVFVGVNADNLAAGTYNAIITIDGRDGGSQQVPVTLTVNPAGPPVPTITSVTNAATFAAGPVAPGSLATIFGSNFAGQKVSVTFNNLPATVLFSNNTQINLEVPTELASQTNALVVVTVDGRVSVALNVQLVSFAPGIFAGGVLNQDNVVNSATAPAPPGSILQIFATGLSGLGTFSVQLAGQTITNLAYAGAAPGLSGVQQINVMVPLNLQPMTTSVAVCGTPVGGGAMVCSPAVPLVIANP
jgi:uncharacterized protein (TIGR03437 family)